MSLDRAFTRSVERSLAEIAHQLGGIFIELNRLNQREDAKPRLELVPRAWTMEEIDALDEPVKPDDTEVIG